MERAIRGGIFTLALLPFIWVVYAAATGGLGPDPAEALMHFTGEWSLRLLALTLLVSPLRAWTGWSLLLKLRRMLGLYAFFYGCIHLLSFLQFFVGWTPAGLLEELVERPYITMGFAAWLLMLPLAITSTRGMQRRLRRNWQRLHRLVYPAAVLGCLHLLWQARSDIGEPLFYIGIFALLLGWRLKRRHLKRRTLVAAKA
jgi:sulfoxide reductase heme-binding subunit YedZ